MGLIFPIRLIAQGFNHVWLIGNQISFDTNTTAPKARILFDSNSDLVIGEIRKMAFSGTEASISDANGNFLFASNGCWIMDSTGDTMMNGSGINPSLFTDSWNSPTSGLPIPNGAIILPYPGDSSRFVMFHQTGNYIPSGLVSTQLYYSVIDMTQNGGLGGVDSTQKNNVILQDTLSWGIAACKHANGRDWWIVVLKDSTNMIFKVLFSSNGVESINSQNLNLPTPTYKNVITPCFSPDGNKFAFKNGFTSAGGFHDTRILSFDRCTGVFDSLGYAIHNNEFGFGLAFSPNSKFLYYSSSGKIHQLDTDAPNISMSDTLVATYDGYCYPYASLCTNFWLMYLAANGKIYITSSNYVIDLHYINLPDNPGIACDVHQHDLRVPCYTSNEGINHPNYYLGPVTGSVCDSLGLSIPEVLHDFRFHIYPNPVLDNLLNIGYQLPQNKSGLFQIYDITGKIVFKNALPQWSNEQSFKLPKLGDGVYNCKITSGNVAVNKKFVVFKN